MKLANVKFTAVAYFEKNDDVEVDCRMFCSEQALSRWANRQYHKDENVTIDVYEGVGTLNKHYCTYHA